MPAGPMQASTGSARSRGIAISLLIFALGAVGIAVTVIGLLVLSLAARESSGLAPEPAVEELPAATPEAAGRDLPAGAAGPAAAGTLEAPQAGAGKASRMVVRDPATGVIWITRLQSGEATPAEQESMDRILRDTLEPDGPLVIPAHQTYELTSPTVSAWGYSYDLVLPAIDSPPGTLAGFTWKGPAEDSNHAVPRRAASPAAPEPMHLFCSDPSACQDGVHL